MAWARRVEYRPEQEELLVSCAVFLSLRKEVALRFLPTPPAAFLSHTHTHALSPSFSFFLSFLSFSLSYTHKHIHRHIPRHKHIHIYIYITHIHISTRAQIHTNTKATLSLARPSPLSLSILVCQLVGINSDYRSCKQHGVSYTRLLAEFIQDAHSQLTCLYPSLLPFFLYPRTYPGPAGTQTRAARVRLPLPTDGGALQAQRGPSPILRQSQACQLPSPSPPLCRQQRPLLQKQHHHLF